MTTVRKIGGITAMVLSLGLAMVSCGDPGPILPGGGGTGVQRTTTGIGPISGLGSIVVNGIQYDDSTARIADDRGNELQSSDLRLGMTVVVQGSVSADEMAGIADSIEVFSLLGGTVKSVADDELVINGVSVEITRNTVVGNSQALINGNSARVFGAFNPTNERVIATRIDAAPLVEDRLTGIVSGWLSNANEFNVGGVRINYNGLTLPAAFDNGVEVRVDLERMTSGQILRATDIQTVDTPSLLTGELINFIGVVAEVPDTATFLVDGQLVNGAVARVIGGTVSDVVAGAVLRVNGIVVNGVLNASMITIESLPNQTGGTPETIQLIGPITNFAGVAGFSVRGVTVNASFDPVFVGGDASSLSNDVCVLVSGDLAAGPDASTVHARRIEFRAPDCTSLADSGVIADPATAAKSPDADKSDSQLASNVTEPPRESEEDRSVEYTETEEQAREQEEQALEPEPEPEQGELAEKQAKEQDELAEKQAKEQDELAEKQAKKQDELAEKQAKEQEDPEKQAKEQEELAEKQAKEQEELAEKQAKEQEELAEKQVKEQEELAEKQAKEQEKLAKERAKEQEKLAKERAKEQEKLEKERAKEQEKLAKEQEKLAKEQEKEQEELAKERAKEQEEQAKEQEKLAKERAKEQEELAKEQAKEQEKQAKEQEKLAKEQAKEQEKQAKEQEKLAKEQAKEQEKQAKEQEKQAKEQAKEQEKQAKEQEKL